MNSLFNLGSILGSVEYGLIFAVLAMGVFLSFRTLNTPDLTVDGSIVTGAATSAIICSQGGNPFWALVAAFIAGGLAGGLTALLNTKLKIQPLLSGILVMLGLYSINLRILGGKANIPLASNTIYKMWGDLPAFENNTERFTSLVTYRTVFIGLIIVVVITACFYFFLKTRLGFALRATGDNEDMIRASGVDADKMRMIGLALSNAFVGLSGGLMAQYQSYADINMGVGMVVIGLASVIIGEAIFGIKSLLRRLIAVSLGAVLYRFIIAFALNLGMPASDLKLVSAIIVTFALATGALGERFAFRSAKGEKKVKTVDYEDAQEASVMGVESLAVAESDEEMGGEEDA